MDNEINLTERDYLAFEIMKIRINNQDRQRRMTIISRILWWLGFHGWKAIHEVNATDIINKSYEFADLILIKRETDENIHIRKRI